MPFRFLYGCGQHDAPVKRGADGCGCPKLLELFKFSLYNESM